MNSEMAYLHSLNSRHKTATKKAKTQTVGTVPRMITATTRKMIKQVRSCFEGISSLIINVISAMLITAETRRAVNEPVSA